MKLLDLLAEVISADKEQALKQKFVQTVDKNTPKGMMPFDPNKISDREFKALLDIDETPNGTYLNWLIPRYIKMDRTERKRFFDDGHNEQVKQLLPYFDKNKQKIKNLNIRGFQADINLYKSLRDFENVIGTAKSSIEGSGEEKKQLGPEKFQGINIAPIKIIGETPSGFVVYRVPQSCKGDKNCYNRYEALTGCGDQSQLFDPSKEGQPAPKAGYANKWCTRGSYFDSYLTNGSYYVFKNWKTRRQYQLHYESGQLKDEADQEIKGYNSKLQNEFLQFLLDNEGRIPPGNFSFSLDLSKYKKGDSENGFPIYEIGNKVYMDFGSADGNRLYFYDEATKKLKNQDGRDAGNKVITQMPYMDLLRFIYKQAPDKFPPFYRFLLNLDIPDDSVLDNIPPLNLSDSDITSFPNNVTINGDFDLSNTKMRELPKNLTVLGNLNISGTKLKPRPDTKVQGKIIQ